MSLPKIQGVNQKSLSLLIDQPELLTLNLTPLHRRGDTVGREYSRINDSSIIQEDEDQITTSMVQSPASHIIKSARREAKGLGEITTTMVMSPRDRSGSVSLRGNSLTLSATGRRKASNALMFGGSQSKKRIKLQLQEKVEGSMFGDKVTVQPNAGKLLRNAMRMNYNDE